jgi:hypothetical protein
MPEFHQDASISSPWTLPRPDRRLSDLTRPDKGFGRSCEPNATPPPARDQLEASALATGLAMPPMDQTSRGVPVHRRKSSSQPPAGNPRLHNPSRTGRSTRPSPPVEQHALRFQVTVQDFPTVRERHALRRRDTCPVRLRRCQKPLPEGFCERPPRAIMHPDHRSLSQ